MSSSSRSKVDPSQLLQEIREIIAFLNSLPTGDPNPLLIPGSCRERPLPPTTPDAPYYIDLSQPTAAGAEFRIEITNLTPPELRRLLRHAHIQPSPQGAILTIPHQR
ncbi:MAG: hypothetical protein C0502_05955 [Opitutus sp.]|nr:hypothetical protein [Opitutus sp.]